jgi:hypothetical protein
MRRAQGRLRGIKQLACKVTRGITQHAHSIKRGVWTKVVIALVSFWFLSWSRARFIEYTLEQTRPLSADRCRNLSDIVRRTGATLIMDNFEQLPPWSAEAGYTFHAAVVSPTTELAVGNSTCFVTSNLDCFSEAHGVVFQGAWSGWGLFDSLPYIDRLMSRYRPAGQVWFARSEETPESAGVLSLCALLPALCSLSLFL